MDKLKKKYPYVYGRFEQGNADLEVLRWVFDNYNSIKEDKPEYTVIKESRLLSVDTKGNHTFKTTTHE